jgi:hypothetical protein
MILYFGSLILFLSLSAVIGLEPSMLFSNVINATSAVVTAWILSIVYYKFHIDDYLKQGIIRKQNMALEILSTTDPLTSLFNRRNLDDCITLSTGYYSGKPHPTMEPWTYITKADEALYEAKSNRVLKKHR